MMNCSEIRDGIKIYYDIFSEEERLKIIKQFSPFLEEKYDVCSETGDPRAFKTNQTVYNLLKLCQEDPDNYFNPFDRLREVLNINGELFWAWMNYNTIDTNRYWHQHVYDSCVLMLDNPESIGTSFKIDDEIIETVCPTNSLITVPKLCVHAPPKKITKPRYVLALDFRFDAYINEEDEYQNQIQYFFDKASAMKFEKY